MTRLIKLYFINALKLNSFKTSSNRKKAWGFFILMVFIAASVLFSLGSYAYLMGSGLMQIGAIDLMPVVFMFAASLFVLISAIFSTKGSLFGFKDYDQLMSLPVKTGTLAASRLAILCIYELAFSLLIMLPALGVYAWFTSPPPVFYPFAIICTLLIPVIPLIIGSFLGTLVTLAAARFRRTNVFRIILLLALTLGIMALSFSMNNFSAETVNAIAGMTPVLSSRYPPATLFAGAISGVFEDFALFTVISIGLFLVFSMIVGRLFTIINSAAMSVHTTGNFRISEKAKSSSAQTALLIKELRTYFGSAIYVLNTSFGLVMLLILSAASLFLGKDQVGALLGASEIVDIIVPMLPLGISVIIGMSSTTCCSVSMEGSSFWHIQALPVSAAMVFKAKIGLNLLLSAPAIIISATLLSISFKVSAQLLPFMFITPLVYSLFIASAGLTINLHFPKLNWTNETQAVKQSASALITIILGWIVTLVPIFIVFNGTGNLLLSLTIITLCAALLTLLLCVYLLKRGGKLLLSLI